MALLSFTSLWCEKKVSEKLPQVCFFHHKHTLAIFHFFRKKAYDTAYSQAVTHPSTNAAQSCLTSVIGRELVFSTWYGRRHKQGED
jgi:hypothetical protein